MKNPQIHKMTTDVLIIGGGLAGLNAAIGAAEEGAKVLVMDKGGIARSGMIGGGVDHFLAYLNKGESWDTKEGYLKYCTDTAKGAVDLEIQEAVFCDELGRALERMERIGVSLYNKEGVYYRTKSMGQPGPYWINFNGKRLKPNLAKEVLRLGVSVLEKVVTTRILKRNGAICGATGFGIRSGDFYTIQAKAIIGTTGDTVRLFENPTRNPFNTWHSPYNTGDFQVMAFDVGADLSNMEYVRTTLVPKGFAAPGFNAFFSLGCTLVNGHGERYMERYDKMADRAQRSMLVWSTLNEIREGRGPIFIDTRHLDSKTKNHLFTTLGYDKDTLPDFLKAKEKYGLEEGLIEIMISEGMQGAPAEICGSGIRIDKNCASSIPGLYAAGDCADQHHCVHSCTTGGYLAGKKAASYASEMKRRDVDSREARQEMKRVFAPLQRSKGLTSTEFEDVIRKIMTDHLVPAKNEGGLKLALHKLKNIEPYGEQLVAKNFHELMRVHEAQSLLRVGMMCCVASLARKESRFAPYHFRSDYPERNDQDFCGLVLVRKGKSGEIETGFHRLEYRI